MVVFRTPYARHVTGVEFLRLFVLTEIEKELPDISNIAHQRGRKTTAHAATSDSHGNLLAYRLGDDHVTGTLTG